MNGQLGTGGRRGSRGAAGVVERGAVEMAGKRWNSGRCPGPVGGEKERARAGAVDCVLADIATQ